MKLSEMLENTELIQPRKKEVFKKEIILRGSSGNSADDVLINESVRMANYISTENKNKIVSVRTAYQYGVNKIGTTGDYAGILKSQLIPQTSERAKRIASENFFRLFHNKEKVKFWAKNRYAKQISYLRNGKEISYFMGLNLKTGKRISIPKNIRRGLKK